MSDLGLFALLGQHAPPIPPSSRFGIDQLLPQISSIPATNPLWLGVEIDVLALGDADSILVSFWSAVGACRVLIDAGTARDGPRVASKISSLGIARLDHVVCTHPHNDHSGGLATILQDTRFSIGQFWVHRPWKYIDLNSVRANLGSTGLEIVAGVLESMDNLIRLERVAASRSIPTSEPFYGRSVGPLQILGPTEAFYQSRLIEFTDFSRLVDYDEQMRKYDVSQLAKALFDNTSADETLSGGPTEPENESCVILSYTHGSNRFLFTADAGVNALGEVIRRTDLRNLYWMQVPHHGSGRNLTTDFIKHLRPQFAAISASGDEKHPRRSVVSGLKKVGSKIFSTHHPQYSDMRFFLGAVPTRPGYIDMAAM